MDADVALYRTLFEASTDALLAVDRDGRIVQANVAATQLLDYPMEALLRLSVDDLVPDAVRARHAGFRTDYAAAPRSRPMGTDMDLVARRRDGGLVRVEIALSPLLHAGQPLVLAALRNVTEYPRVRQALRQARFSDEVARLGALAVDTRDPRLVAARGAALAAEGLDLTSACVYLLEPDRRALRVAAGVGLDEHPGVDSLIDNDPRHPAGRVLSDGEVLAVGDPARMAPPDLATLRLPRGQVSLLAVPLIDLGNVQGVLAVWSPRPQTWDEDAVRFLQSLANLLTSSLQRARTEEALNHAQRLESVGQLTGGVAHDFNNLLTVIQGNLQVLEDLPGLADDAFAQQLLGAARRAGNRAAELTGKLLAFSRRQVLRPSAIEAHALVEALADMLRRTLDQRIRISVLPGPAGLCCLADSAQLESALLNLAINARDAMPDGGALSFGVELQHHLPTDCPVEFRAIEVEGQRWVAIKVSDTGTGMPPEVRARAFEPFFTTKPSGRGTGLGLSTVYGFARQSRGAVCLDSEPGVGTTVALYLPWVATPAASSKSAPASDAGSTTEALRLPTGLQVVLVEDEAQVRSVTELFLRGAGCRVRSYANGEEALANAAEWRDEVQLLLSDVALGPGMRGTDLAAQVRQLCPAVPVLLVSGYSSRLLTVSDPDDGRWPLLRKPFTREELLHRAAQALQTR